MAPRALGLEEDTQQQVLVPTNSSPSFWASWTAMSIAALARGER